jgi:NADH:ubiquinone oxidoreductase subunit B-like Fe-S oxidoreductase
MQEAEEKTTDVFYRFRKRGILKENGLRQLELVVCRGRAVHKPAPKRNKTVDALLDPYLA